MTSFLRLAFQRNACHHACADFGERYAGSWIRTVRYGWRVGSLPVRRPRRLVRQIVRSSSRPRPVRMPWLWFDGGFRLEFLRPMSMEAMNSRSRRVDACLFDVLHDAADNDVLAV